MTDQIWDEPPDNLVALCALSAFLAPLKLREGESGKNLATDKRQRSPHHDHKELDQIKAMVLTGFEKNGC